MKTFKPNDLVVFAVHENATIYRVDRVYPHGIDVSYPLRDGTTAKFSGDPSTTTPLVDALVTVAKTNGVTLTLEEAQAVIDTRPSFAWDETIGNALTDFVNAYGT
jgi:hypothetical protein